MRYGPDKLLAEKEEEEERRIRIIIIIIIIIIRNGPKPRCPPTSFGGHNDDVAVNDF